MGIQVFRLQAVAGWLLLLLPLLLPSTCLPLLLLRRLSRRAFPSFLLLLLLLPDWCVVLFVQVPVVLRERLVLLRAPQGACSMTDMQQSRDDPDVSAQTQHVQQQHMHPPALALPAEAGGQTRGTTTAHTLQFPDTITRVAGYSCEFRSHFAM